MYGNGRRALRARGSPRAGAFPHPFRNDPNLLDTSALGRIDHVDDVAVAQRAVAADEHRLVLAILEDGAKLFFELVEADVLVVDRDLLVGGVLQDNLADLLRVLR